MSIGRGRFRQPGRKSRYTRDTSSPSEKFRQLGDVGRNPPRLVAGEWLGARPPVLGVDVSEGLSVMVAHDEIGVLILDGPVRREAALWHNHLGRTRQMSPL